MDQIWYCSGRFKKGDKAVLSEDVDIRDLAFREKNRTHTVVAAGAQCVIHAVPSDFSEDEYEIKLSVAFASGDHAIHVKAVPGTMLSRPKLGLEAVPDHIHTQPWEKSSRTYGVMRDG